MRLVLSFLFCLSLSRASAQGLRQAIQGYADTLAKTEYIEHMHPGQFVSNANSTFIKLSTIATTPELLQLLQHKSPMVKTYAAWALADRKYPDLASIYTQLKKTGEEVHVLSGCFKMTERICHTFYYHVYCESYLHHLSKADSLFFNVQLRKMGGVIIRGEPDAIFILNMVWELNHADPATYKDVRKLALTFDPGAVAALAEYHKPADTTIILSMNWYAFPAIAAFAHPAFWKQLLLYADTCRALSYLGAVAAYKDVKALALLQKMYNNGQIPDDVAAHLAQALDQEYTPAYKDLLSGLWATHCVTTTHFIRLLLKDDPAGAPKIFATGLLTGKLPKSADDESYNAKDSAFMLMLPAITDKTVLEKICLRYIKQAKEPGDVWPVLEAVTKNKITAAIPMLNTRLQNARYPYEMYSLVDCLLAFQQPAVTDNVKKYLISKRQIWDQDNFAINFRQLFKKYNIML